jgi:hypothetical protein
MMASAFIIALVVELVTSQRLPITSMPILPDAKLIKYLFFGAAAAEFVLIRFVNSRLLSNRAPVLLKGRASRYSPDIQRLMTASVLSFAFCESVAVFGLALFLMSRPSDFYLFLLISLIFFAVSFPQCGGWRSGRLGRSGNGEARWSRNHENGI